MAKNPTQDQFELALKLKEDGASYKEICEESGLNYSQAWLYITRAQMPKSEYLPNPTAEQVKAARDEGQSWGYIAVRANVPESQIRRRFEEASGLKSKGLRIGKGGRFAYGEPGYYQGENARTGIAIPKGVKGRPPLPSELDALRGMKLAELKALAEKRGVEVEGKLTKGNLINALSSSL